MYEFVIRGTRGQRPACGADFEKYGGRTTCYSLRTKSGVVLFDAGTGLASVPNLAREEQVTLIFTHLHIDHLLGLPALLSGAGETAQVRVMADPRRETDWRRDLRTFVGRPFWPVELGEFRADIQLVDLPVADDVLEFDGVRLTWMRVPHPQQCLSYRLELPGTTVVIATDAEFDPAAVPDDFVTFCRDADYLIIDAELSPAEYPRYRGWGHSCWLVGTHVAKRAGVSKLILTHHAATRTDAEIDGLLGAARSAFPSTEAAFDNMCLVCPHAHDI